MDPKVLVLLGCLLVGCEDFKLLGFHRSLYNIGVACLFVGGVQKSAQIRSMIFGLTRNFDRSSCKLRWADEVQPLER